MARLTEIHRQQLQIRPPETTLGISGSSSDLAAEIPSPGPL
jgi:hypothetical protein